MNISLRDDPRYNWWLVLGLVAGIYCLVNLALPRIPISGLVGSYVVQPILWGLLAWAIIVLPKYRLAGKLRLKSSIIQLGLLIGFFQIVVSVIGGLFSSFGKSPYSFTPLGIFTNLIFVASMLVGMELSRAWLVNRLGRHHTFLALGFVTVLYTLLCLPLSRIASLGGNIESVRYLNSTCLPLLSENLLASFLAFLAGPLASIAYRGTLQAFQWFCPVLPDPTWVLKGLIGTVVPIMGLVVVQGFHSSQTRRTQVRRAKEGSLTGWIITTIIAVLIIWFSVGLFPFHPTTVLSGSMRPVLDAGDVVIVAKAPADVVNQGDIIQFRKEKVSVMHRVVDIQEWGDSSVFITKGDANEDPDSDPVVPEQVVGKVVFKIPKIGWVAIVVKEFFTG